MQSTENSFECACHGMQLHCSLLCKGALLVFVLVAGCLLALVGLCQVCAEQSVCESESRLAPPSSSDQYYYRRTDSSDVLFCECQAKVGGGGGRKRKMANTGVLPFVRGVDFTNNDFSVSIWGENCIQTHARDAKPHFGVLIEPIV